MKKLILFIVSGFIMLSACGNRADCETSESQDVNAVYATAYTGGYDYWAADASGSTVYICTGPSSKRYHCDSHCQGFSRCSGDIRAISISQARAMGRTPCKWCYN